VANSPEIDFALVLSRTIDSIKNDPSQLRNTVYELARTKLLMLAWEQNPRITVLGLRRICRPARSGRSRLRREGCNSGMCGEGASDIGQADSRRRLVRHDNGLGRGGIGMGSMVAMSPCA